MQRELSIIIPVYNVETYIAQCINSIKSQSLKNFEAIIVNDGSIDSSISICEQLILGDNRFRIIHKGNGGLMSAWKYGISLSEGKYIGFVDSDDWIDSNMFETLLSKIKEYNADIVISGYITEGSDYSKQIGRNELYVFERSQIHDSFIKEYCNSYFSSTCTPTINRWDKIYRRDIIINNMHLFNEKVSLAEDFNMNIATILDSQKIVLLPDFTPYHYRCNPKSIVNSINPNAFSNIKELSIACTNICNEKNFHSIYIDGFIGNIIFEEINRICQSDRFTQAICKDLSNKIDACNGLYYLNCYSKVRNCYRIFIYDYFIQRKAFKSIYILNRLYIKISKNLFH